jgi:hypothetical protein
MAIVYRDENGENLTPQQVDANFRTLEDRQTELTEELANKASLDVDGKVTQTALNSDKWGGYTYAQKAAQPLGLATLGSDGKIPASQLPAIALTSIQTVSDVAAMLALTSVQGGDAVKVTATGVTYILITDADPSDIDGWVAIGDSLLVIADIAGLQAALDDRILTSNIINDLVHEDTDKPASALQVKTLKGLIDGLATSKQNTIEAATGWTSNTGAESRAGFNTASFSGEGALTLIDLAGYVAALIKDLKTKGILAD